MSQQLWIRFILHSFTEIENKRKQFRWDQFHRSNSDFLFAIVRLPNEGNTCYINSMVQALLALADFTGGVAGLCRRRRRNGEAGDAQVEERVRREVGELCEAFPVYPGRPS